ncbi:MAG: recombination mediator RecR [Candidatus Uhrbacteria bacterium]|nr:recombination mediator RecR [Candidatus Uhrbacteria bacterium]
MKLPQPINDAAAAFDGLPGVGPRAALRYAYWLVTQPKEALQRFARSISALADQMKICDTCHDWSETSPCEVCRDSGRDASLLCVVATSQNLQAIEETGIFKGHYHVLGGLLDPIEGRTPETLNIPSLLNRLSILDSPFSIHEVILAFDADIPGDTTALYIRKQLTGMPVRITRLARGLPTGAALEYADAYTLADALNNIRV